MIHRFILEAARYLSLGCLQILFHYDRKLQFFSQMFYIFLVWKLFGEPLCLNSSSHDDNIAF